MKHQALYEKLRAEMSASQGDHFDVCKEMVRETVSNAIELKVPVADAVETAKQVFDEIVAPRDIASIPEFAEASLDVLSWKACAVLINRGLKFLTYEAVATSGQ
jgi:hypothetical protein